MDWWIYLFVTMMCYASVVQWVIMKIIYWCKSCTPYHSPNSQNTNWIGVLLCRVLRRRCVCFVSFQRNFVDSLQPTMEPFITMCIVNVVDRCESSSRHRKCFCDRFCGLPTCGGPFFNPGDFGSASADKSCGLSLRWTIPRPGCSSRNSRTLVSGTYSVFVVRVPGWIRWVKLNFSSAVSELSTESKELADGEMWGGEILVVTDLFC